MGRRGALLIVLSGLVVGATMLVAKWSLSGIAIEDELRDPMSVHSVSEDRIVLQGGQIIEVPGFRILSRSPQAATKVLKRGVEVRSDHSVYCLIGVFHECGDDPVRTHVEKVRLDDLIAVLADLVEHRQIETVDGAFVDDTIDYGVFVKLLERTGSGWDGHNSVEFP